MRVYEGSNVEPEEFVIVSPKPIPQGRSFKLRSYNKDQKWLGDVPMEAGVGKALSDWYRENSAFFAVDDPLREALLTLRVRKEGDDDDPRYVPSIAKAQILVGRFVPDTRSPRGDLVYATLIVGETGLTKDIDNLPDWPSRLDRKYLALHDDRRMREIQLHMKRNRQKQDMARLDRNMGSMIRQGHIDAQREFEARRNFLRGHGWPL